ncbi:MAG TPA: hypothetical protein VE953_11040 [Terriglobales bacterium]|nr:hypothetical protein [Terriglobales bacterium]
MKVTDTASPAMRTWSVQWGRAAHAVLEEQAIVVEQRMKAEHRWVNRTGAAEAHLHCEIFDAGGKSRMIAFCAVPYYKYLAVRRHGYFDILLPVMRSEWPRTMAKLRARCRAVNAKA